MGASFVNFIGYSDLQMKLKWRLLDESKSIKLAMTRAGSAEGTTQLRLTQFEMHPCLYYRVP